MNSTKSKNPFTFCFTLATKVVHKLSAIIMPLPRKLHVCRLRKRLKNSTPTIISSDCVGSVIYHDLGLQFRSPTINLAIPGEDFLIFVQNLDAFLSAEVEEDIQAQKPYPVGKLQHNGMTVQLQFIHYVTFAQAKAKWDERRTRVDFSNLYVIQNLPQCPCAEHLQAFDSLPYKNKLLITNSNPTNSPNIVALPIFDNPKYIPGQILFHKHLFSCKRYLEDIDYVCFLNREQ